MPEARELLKSSQLFRQVSDSVVDLFVEKGRRHSFSAGDVLVAEHGTGEDVYLILEGDVEKSVALANAPSEAPAITSGAGELVGLLHIIDQADTLTITAKTDLRTLVWKVSVWNELCEAHPEAGYRIALGIATVVAERAIRLNLKVLDNVNWGLE